MKIRDVTVTLFGWDEIPPTRYSSRTARTVGKSQLGLVTITTDEGIEGHAFLGSAYAPADLDAPALVRVLKPALVGQDPLDRERLRPMIMLSRRRRISRPDGTPTKSIRRRPGARTSRYARRCAQALATTTR